MPSKSVESELITAADSKSESLTAINWRWSRRFHPFAIESQPPIWIRSWFFFLLGSRSLHSYQERNYGALDFMRPKAVALLALEKISDLEIWGRFGDLEIEIFLKEIWRRFFTKIWGSRFFWRRFGEDFLRRFGEFCWRGKLGAKISRSGSNDWYGSLD